MQCSHHLLINTKRIWLQQYLQTRTIHAEQWTDTCESQEKQMKERETTTITNKMLQAKGRNRCGVTRDIHTDKATKTLLLQGRVTQRKRELSKAWRTSQAWQKSLPRMRSNFKIRRVLGKAGWCSSVRLGSTSCYSFSTKDIQFAAGWKIIASKRRLLF